MKRPDWLMWKINVDMPLALTEIDLVIKGILHAYSTKELSPNEMEHFIWV